MKIFLAGLEIQDMENWSLSQAEEAVDFWAARGLRIGIVHDSGICGVEML